MVAIGFKFENLEHNITFFFGSWGKGLDLVPKKPKNFFNLFFGSWGKGPDLVPKELKI